MVVICRADGARFAVDKISTRKPQRQRRLPDGCKKQRLRASRSKKKEKEASNDQCQFEVPLLPLRTILIFSGGVDIAAASTAASVAAAAAVRSRTKGNIARVNAVSTSLQPCSRAGRQQTELQTAKIGVVPEPVFADVSK